MDPLGKGIKYALHDSVFAEIKVKDSVIKANVMCRE